MTTVKGNQETVEATLEKLFTQQPFSLSPDAVGELERLTAERPVIVVVPHAAAAA